jgi:hypothetical protein
LTGSIPTEIGLAKSLVELELGVNQFSGTLPSKIEQLDHLELLGVNNNTLQGTIPGFLGRMTHIRHLQLYESGLTGTLPETFCNATRRVKRVVVVKCDQERYCSCYSRTDANATARVECISDFPWLVAGEG